MMERPEWKPGDRLLSIRDIGSILLEAGKEVVLDTVNFVKVKAADAMARADERMFDRFGGEDD